MREDVIVAALWERYRALAAEQVGVLEAWARGAGSGDEARTAAHKLAGSLGSYGRPDGSRAALELEQHLVHDRSVPADEVRRLLDLLRSSLD